MKPDKFSLDGKRYLVTGAASGIGRATAAVLSGLGADLLLADINSEGLDETLKYCKNTDRKHIIDLSHSDTIRDKVLSATDNFGKLNGFVHLAGKSYITPLKSLLKEKCDELYRLNTYAVLELAKVFISKNVFAGENGSIVLVSSVYANVGSAANVAYAMTKSALHGITRSLAIELAGRNIRVNCVAPGFIWTKMMENNLGSFDENYLEKLKSLHPLGLGNADDVAYSIAFLLSDAARWITGSILNVDGGFTAQ